MLLSKIYIEWKLTNDGYGFWVQRHQVGFEYMRKLSLVNETRKPETETFDFQSETRPRHSHISPRRDRDVRKMRLETETSRRRPHLWFCLILNVLKPVWRMFSADNFVICLPWFHTRYFHYCIIYLLFFVTFLLMVNFWSLFKLFIYTRCILLF